jgi:ParB family chromosome partitioning protein
MQTNAPETMGVIYRLQMSQLHPHPQNPFSIRDDQAMLDLIQSVQSHGVLVPAIARPRPDGEYEIIAGHRRKHASELAGLDFMPVVVLDLNDDEAIIQLVDSNIQRENILPSERAKAYKMRMEAMKRQGARTDLTSPNISAKFRSDDELGQEVGVSGDTIRNYASLTNLVPELMQMVDEGRIKLSPAYQIAALPHNEQSLLLDTIESEQATPSLSQAQRMKRLSQNGELNEDVLLEIMMEQKKPVRNDITLSGEKLRKYFPKSYSPIQMENVIFKLLAAWQRKRQRDQSR